MEKQSTAGFWLSPQQKHVWSWQQPNRQQNAGCTVRLKGPVEEAALRRALERAISRHEILRTVFVRQSGMKVPFQVIRESLEPTWQNADLRNLSLEEQNAELEKIVGAGETSGLNLESGPVVHATLAQLGSDRWMLVLSVPGLSSDFRSLQNLVHEIGTIYAGDESKLNAEPLRYVQFAQWQSDLLESEDEAAKKAKESWARLAGPDSLALPGEIRNPQQDAFDPQSLILTMDPGEIKTLETVAEKNGASAGDVLLGAWQSLVTRLTGQATFAVGVFLNGREYEELQDALGIVGKTLPVPARFDGDFRFSEVLHAVSAATKQAVEWQEHYAPGECDLPIGFEFRDLPAKRTFKDVSFRMERTLIVPERTKLKLVGVRGDGGLTLEFHYDASRFARSSVERIAAYFQTLLASALQAPETPVSRLPLLPAAERRQLLTDWNQTAAPYPQDRCLHQLFEAQAARTPERLALVSGDQQLSYRQWNEQANQLAHHLRSLGVGPDALVGLCLDRSAGMMVALLAILKAGGAYVALNPDNPKPRLAQQLSGAVALITEARLLAQMPDVPRPYALPWPR